MRAKDYLKKMEKIDSLIVSKLQQKDDLRNMRITASYSDMPRGGSCPGDKVGDIVGKIAELDDEIDNKIEDLVDLKLEATRLIDQLDARESLLLDMRYIQGKEWEEIARVFSYEERSIHRIHSKALNQLDGILAKHVSKCQ